MNDGPEWFAPKRYGYGTGLPISWQGWAVLAAYLALVIGAATLLSKWPLAVFGVAVPATALFMLIAMKTTRGGWRWRCDRTPRD